MDAVRQRIDSDLGRVWSSDLAVGSTRLEHAACFSVLSGHHYDIVDQIARLGCQAVLEWPRFRLI